MENINFYDKIPVFVGTGSQSIDCYKLLNGFVLHVDQEHFTQCLFKLL